MLSDLIASIEAIEALNTLDAPDPAVAAALLSYLKCSWELPYTNPETIIRAQEALGRSAAIWAWRHSPVYKSLIDPEDLKEKDCLRRIAGKFTIGKSDLRDNERWFVPEADGTPTQTNGTTGAPFAYRIWNPCFPMIERDRHYRLVLDEFGMGDTARVLHLVSGMSVPDSQVVHNGAATLHVAYSHHIKNYVQRIHCSHGAGDAGDADFFHIDFDEEAFLHIRDFCGYVVKFIETNRINVILASGGFFELLTTYLIADESHAFPRITTLLSNTGDRCNIDTMEFLVETGVADHYCDHMRCWDGGLGFFTCSHSKYHLTEELSYAFTDAEGKVATVDFFNHASPFVNYLNGDFAEIGDTWSKCECGRWLRPFKFLNRRSRTSRNQAGGYYDTAAIHARLKEKYGIEFVSFQDNLVTIEDSVLDDTQKQEIVRDLAKEQIATHFFTSRNIRPMLLATKSSTISTILAPVSLVDDDDTNLEDDQD